jgi:hypothetical protein
MCVCVYDFITVIFMYIARPHRTCNDSMNALLDGLSQMIDTLAQKYGHMSAPPRPRYAGSFVRRNTSSACSLSYHINPALLLPLYDHRRPNRLSLPLALLLRMYPPMRSRLILRVNVVVVVVGLVVELLAPHAPQWLFLMAVLHWLLHP